VLGCWQVRRREWKLELIERIHQQMTQPPMPLTQLYVCVHARAPHTLHSLSIPADERGDLEYKSVSAVGTFDHAREIVIAPRSLVELGDEQLADAPDWVLKVS
jgi:cytochrome oxidase assembly protein ShyY1